MPEAVDSNSIPMPKGQQFSTVIFETDLDAFSETIDQLRVLVDMVVRYLYDTSIKRQAGAIGGLFRIMADDLCIHCETAKRDFDVARAEIVEAKRKADGSQARSVSSAITLRLIGMVVEILTEDGHEPKQGDEPARRHVVGVAQSYTEKVLAQMQNPSDMLEAGSFLPWAEAAMRRQLTNDGLGGVLLRDQLINEQAAAGVSASDLSGAFNIKRAAVERIIGRLSGAVEGDRAAV